MGVAQRSPTAINLNPFGINTANAKLTQYWKNRTVARVRSLDYNESRFKTFERFLISELPGWCTSLAVKHVERPQKALKNSSKMFLKTRFYG